MTDTDTGTDTDTDIDSLGFEERLERLDEIVERLEADDVGLDDSLSLYEEGVRLLDACRDRLDEAETKIESLGDAEIDTRTEADSHT